MLIVIASFISNLSLPHSLFATLLSLSSNISAIVSTVIKPSSNAEFIIGKTHIKVLHRPIFRLFVFYFTRFFGFCQYFTKISLKVFVFYILILFFSIDNGKVTRYNV